MKTEPKTVRDLIQTLGKKGLQKRYLFEVVGDKIYTGEVRLFLNTCSFVISMAEGQADERCGEYALDQLLRDLPLATLQRYKVETSKAPQPVAVRGKK